MSFKADFEKMMRDRVASPQEPCIFTIIGPPGSGKTTFAKNCADAFKRAALYPGEVSMIYAGGDLESQVFPKTNLGMTGSTTQSVSPFSKPRSFAIIDEIHAYSPPFVGQAEKTYEAIFDQVRKSRTELVFTAYKEQFNELLQQQSAFTRYMKDKPVFDMADPEADMDIAENVIDTLRREAAARQAKWLEEQRLRDLEKRKRDINDFLRAPASSTPAAAARFKLPQH